MWKEETSKCDIRKAATPQLILPLQHQDLKCQPFLRPLHPMVHLIIRTVLYTLIRIFLVILLPIVPTASIIPV